jgi:lysophospholipase L1-like esterase
MLIRIIKKIRLYLILGGIVSLFPFWYFAQVSPYSLSFVDYSKNKILYPRDSSLMMSFFDKVDEMRSGKRDKITIVHYGGSHIQAGIWDERLLNNFQALGNFEGGGIFAFPFKIAKTNSPAFYKSYTNGNWKRFRCVTKEMCPNLGMAGIAVVSNDSANTFGIKLNKNDHHKKFNSIKVYHNFNPSFKFELCEGTPKYIREDVQDKGYSVFMFEAFTDSVNFSLVKVDTTRKDFMLYGFSLDNPNPGFYLAAFGVNGAGSYSYLKCDQFAQQLETLKPDLVIFSLGVNDTQGKDFTKEVYINNYDSLISMVRLASPDCALLLTTTTDNYIRRKTANKRPVKAQDAMFEMMETHKAAVWDLYGLMGGYKSMYKWQKAGLAAKDKVHFNGRGYNVVGQLMFDAINNSYKYNTKIK